MAAGDIAAVVNLQKLAFPPPFSEDLHWDPEHLLGHVALFPEGQLVAEVDGAIVGSCSNTLISEERWQAHEGWYRTVGGPDLRCFDPAGSTLYGLDITVAPEYRRKGIGRSFYDRRFELVRSMSLVRYGTGCRAPDFRTFQAKMPDATVEEYAEEVVSGNVVDRTFTPLLRYGLRFLGVIRDYMPDYESDNCGMLLEWTP